MSEFTEQKALARLSSLLIADEIDYTQYVGNPLGFIKDYMEINVWSKQEEVIQSVLENRFTSVESGHGTGKSYVMALLACWWLSCNVDEAIVITIAPTHAQVAGIIWRYIRFLGRKYHLPGNIFETSRWDIAPNRYAVGLSPRKASKEDMITLQGYHSKNLLVILDEAAGLPRILYDGVVSLCVGENNKVVAIGNPIEKSGPFYESCNSPMWNSIRISCLEHPNVIQNREVIPGAVSRSWVENMIAEHCTVYKDANFPIEVVNKMTDIELQSMCPPNCFVYNRVVYVPDGVFESKVLGRPPDESSDQLIPLSWVETSKQTELLPDGEKILGVDPARYGGDYSTICLRHGKKVHWVKRKRPITADPTGEIAGWVRSEVSNLGGDVWVFVDEIGVGAGVLDAIRRIGINARGVSFSKKARQNKRFANKRAELWWRVREALQKRDINIPDDDLLSADLTAPRYSFDSMGRVIIEDKDEIKKRIGRSPDSGDALVLTFAAPSLDVVDNAESIDIQKQTIAPGSSRWFIETKPAGSRWKNNGFGFSRWRR